MRLSYTLHREEYVAALAAVVGSISETDMHRSWNRRLRLVPYFYYSAMAFAGVLAVTFEPGSLRGVIILLVTLLLLQCAIDWFVKSIETAQLGATFEPSRHQDVTAIVEPEGATYLGREHKQTWKWTLLQRFHELPAVYVLEFAGFEMLVVPRRAFTSSAEAESWAGGIRNRLA